MYYGHSNRSELLAKRHDVIPVKKKTGDCSKAGVANLTLIVNSHALFSQIILYGSHE